MTTDLLAILVTDIVGSTATRSRIGEERADSLQSVHDEILKAAVVAGHGEVLKGTGDGIIATFRSATDALATAIAIQQQLDAYSRSTDAIASGSVGTFVSFNSLPVSSMTHTLVSRTDMSSPT